MLELKNKRVLVVGLGKSGLAAARFLKTLGARVTVSDARPATLIAELSELLDQGFMVEAGSHGLLTFRRQDLIVVSPGVPMSTPELKQVRAMGAHIIGELELGSQFLQGEAIAITGSNGKRIFRMAPLHHHFELMGWSESKVITRFWITALVFALFALTTLKLR